VLLGRLAHGQYVGLCGRMYTWRKYYEMK